MLSGRSFVCSASLATLKVSHTSGAESNAAARADVHYYVLLTNLIPCVVELKLKYKCDSIISPQLCRLKRLTSWTRQPPSPALSHLPQCLIPMCQHWVNRIISCGYALEEGAAFSLRPCVYPLIPQKKFTSTRKVLGDLATSQTCSVLHSCFPQGAG